MHNEGNNLHTRSDASACKYVCGAFQLIQKVQLQTQEGPKTAHEGPRWPQDEISKHFWGAAACPAAGVLDSAAPLGAVSRLLCESCRFFLLSNFSEVFHRGPAHAAGPGSSCYPRGPIFGPLLEDFWVPFRVPKLAQN